MNLPPMSDRYDLLLDAMHKAAQTVLIVFVASMVLLAGRWLIRWLVQPASVPAPLRTIVTDGYDLFLIAIVLVLFWVMP